MANIISFSTEVIAEIQLYNVDEVQKKRQISSLGVDTMLSFANSILGV